MWTKGQKLQARRYTVVRRLGGGGFGLTYLATDSFFNRQVVIKTPNDTFQADQDYEKYVRRFQREGQTLAKIEHPNVVRVFGFFEEAAMPCLVMDYVEGETLHERLRNQGLMAEDEAIEIFRKLASALQKVHETGIFHCDIHLGNVILQSSGEPVLIDFGSAKRIFPTTITVTTTINQSFSPYEQQNPKNEPKATLDIYSLAATLFFTVTGTKPVSSINRKLYGDSLEFPQASKSKLSMWFQSAILKGMALEEQNRPPSMQAWLRLLHPPRTIDTELVVDRKYLLQAEQVSVNEENASQISYQLTDKQSSSEKRVERALPQQLSFPWIPLFLFLTSNIPTGTCLWTLGSKLGTTVGEAWGLLLAGILSVILSTAMAWTGGLAWAWALAVVFVWSWAWDMNVAWVLDLHWAVDVAWAWAGAWVAAWVAAQAGAGPWAWAWAGAGAGAGAGAVAWALAGAADAAWALAGAWAGAWAGLILRTLGENWAEINEDQLEEESYWKGLGGSATALAGFIVGLSSSLLNNVVLSIVVFILSGLQMVMMVKNLKPIAVFLSNYYSSKVKPFTILNATCILGMLCGGGIAWWFSSSFKL